MSPSLPSIRSAATLAVLTFAPVLGSYFLYPGRWWLDYPGILFHLSIFLLVPQLKAAEWARAAGYGWLLLDVTVAVMTLNHVPVEIAMPIRLGGHIFAGLWIANVSWHSFFPVKLVGLLAGAWLCLYSFVSPFLAKTALAPASLLVIMWLGLIAWQGGAQKSGAR